MADIDAGDQVPAPWWPTCEDRSSGTDRRCRGRRVDGFDYCLAHLEPEQLDEALQRLSPGADLEAPGTVINAELFGRILRAVASRDQPPMFGAVDLDQARFDEGVDFEGVQFGGDASFEHAQFAAVSFERAQFGYAARFGHTQFTANASFDAARFAADASFKHAQFAGSESLEDVQLPPGLPPSQRLLGGGRTSFEGTQFNKGASFDDAQLPGGARFERAYFGGWASFARAQFGGDASFEHAQFWGVSFERAQFAAVSFTDAQFGYAARFGHTQFAANASFDAARFDGDASFEHAQFAGSESSEDVQLSPTFFSRRLLGGGHTSFEGTQFNKGASFDDAQLPGGARFERAYFSKWASFARAHFGGDAGFEHVHFGGFVTFAHAKFDQGARFDDAQLYDASLAHAHFGGDASFAKTQFGEDAPFDDAQLPGGAWFERAYFGGWTSFARAHFGGDAGFEHVHFGGYTSFARAQIGGRASFSNAQFEDAAVFDATRFQGYADFAEAQFSGDTWFQGTQFSGEAWFFGARFEKATSLGPLAANWLDLREAVFVRPVVIQAAAVVIVCTGTTWEAGMTMWLRYAILDLGRATFSVPSFVGGADRPFEFLGELAPSPGEDQAPGIGEDQGPGTGEGQSPGTGEDQVPRPESLVLPLDETEICKALPAVPRASKDLWVPLVSSLRGVDAFNLSVTDVDLSGCQFAGARLLDQFRLEGRCLFDHPPKGLKVGWAWPTVWRWSRRQSLAEERKWRITTPKYSGWDKTRSAESAEVRPERLAGLYRQLRKAQEDAKNEPGAADFYYGEMEMRRHSGTTPAAERTIVWLYWLISGYGLRALRSLAALVILGVIVTTGLTGWGLAAADLVTAPPQHLVGTITTTPRGRVQINAMLSGISPQLPRTNQRWTTERTRTAVEVTLESFVFRSTDQPLTTTGAWITAAARILGPVLLALTLLAVRNRVRR